MLRLERPRPRGLILGVLVGLLLVGAVGCGAGDEAPGATGAPGAPSSSTAPQGAGGDEPGNAGGDEPGDEPGGQEPGTGSEVQVELPATTAVGHVVEVQVSVAVGSHEPTWNDAVLSVATEGPASATVRVDVAALAPGGEVHGTVALDIPPGTDDAAALTQVTITLRLKDGDEAVVTRAALLTVLADDQQAWFSRGSEGEVRRARLDDLLAAGDISQAEYDAARAATLESSPVGTIETLAPSDRAT